MGEEGGGKREREREMHKYKMKFWEEGKGTTWLSMSLMTNKTGLSREHDLRYRVFKLVPCSCVL